MKSLFRYPGSKAKLLEQIMPFIEHGISKSPETFCDAFVGGGSVLLAVAAKYPNIKLYCNDKDWFIYCFWKLMACGSQEDIDLLKLLLSQKPTIELYYRLRQEKPDTEIEAAYRAIFFNRTSFSGSMKHSASAIGGKTQASRYKVDCRYNTEKILSKINDIYHLLNGRTIVSNDDINKYPVLNQDVCMYLDPPYVAMGHMLYQEYMKLDEHRQLSKILNQKDNWILSYDNCDTVLDMYNWANIHFIDASYCIRGTKTSWHKTKEVLIMPVLVDNLNVVVPILDPAV